MLFFELVTFRFAQPIVLEPSEGTPDNGTTIASRGAFTNKEMHTTSTISVTIQTDTIQRRRSRVNCISRLTTMAS
ncbi:hypothetical protein NJ7G_2300 [Natrinema sp. J7-2]|nr:hypothetical protein NJ7G_2300 [Natrinema sp. J7-2]